MAYHPTDRFENWFITSLQTDVNDTTTSFRLNKALNVNQCRLVIDPYDESKREIVKVTSVDGTLVYVERGDDNTSPEYHNEGTIVALHVIAADLNDLYADWAEYQVDMQTQQDAFENSVNEHIDDVENMAFLAAHPVESVYIGVNDSNPQDYFGGSWIDTGQLSGAPEVINHSTNPSFETGGGTVEVRRNLVRNPGLAGGPSLASGFYTISTLTSYSCSGGVQSFTVGVGSATRGVGTIHADNPMVLPNSSSQVTLSVNIDALSIGIGGTVHIRSEGRNASGTWVENYWGPAITSTGRHSFTFTKSSSVVSVLFQVVSGGTITSGTTSVSFSKPMVEQIGAALPYFDGSTNDGFDTASLTPAWTGTANNSASVLNGTAPVGFDDSSTGNSVCWLSSDSPNHGSKFVRGLIKNNSTVAFNCRDTSGTTAELLTGSMYVRSSRAVNAMARWITSVNFNVNVVGTVSLPLNSWHEIRDTRTVGHNNMGLSLLFNPSPFQAGDIIDIDNHMVVKGNYTGEYRDGTSPKWSWDGTPNASTSVGVYPMKAWVRTS